MPWMRPCGGCRPTTSTSTSSTVRTPTTPIDETLAALDDVVRSGKVRYVGCSNFLAYQVARAIGRSEALGVVRFDSVQPRYNLLFREIERELLPLCAEEGIGVIPYNPIAGGLLSGKHNPQAGPDGGDAVHAGHRCANATRTATGTKACSRPSSSFGRSLHQAGMSLPQMAVAWVLANPAITAPIIGASRPEQLDDTLRAAETEMPGSLKAALDELTAQYRRGDAAR